MSEGDRLERLEARVARLEEFIGQRGGEAASAGQQGSGAARQVRSQSQTAPQPRGPTAQRAPAPLLSPEQWIGQRVLLAIGVVALILAAGYLLRLSFDRGWISPVMRCIGGAVSGFIVGAVGWRLHPRYRTYGAALIGCGAAIIYLSVWAAVRLYGVVPPTTGIVALALVSVSLAMIAYAIDVEALGTTMGVAQTFAGLARVAAPILATITFQRLGHGWPFYVAAGYVALVGLMAFQVEVHPRVTKGAAEGAEA